MPPRAKKKTVADVGPQAVTETAADQFVSLDVAVSRLIAELSEHRIRQRALLEVLRDGHFTWDAYVDSLRSVRLRDYDALMGSLVLREEAFSEQFAAWVEADSRRYLFELKPNEPLNKSERTQASASTKKRIGRAPLKSPKKKS